MTRSLSYDDQHGYDFVEQIETERPTGTLVDQRVPDSDTNAYVIGRIAKRTLSDATKVLSDTELDYTGPKVAFRSDLVVERGTGGAQRVEAEFEYDPFGNLIRETTPSPEDDSPIVTAEHSRSDLEFALDCFARVGQELGIIGSARS